MSFAKKTKRFLVTLILAVIFVSFSYSAFAITGHDVGEFFNDMFDMGDQGLSFTQYEGQLAQLSTEGYNKELVASTDLREFVIKIVNFALGFLGLIAVIIVIYGGVLYVTAAGEEEKTQTGKKAITYAVVGLLIIMGSFAFVNTIIKGAVGGDDRTGSSLQATGSSSIGFNAASEDVRALAVEVLNGFKFLEESTQDLLNIKNDAEKESILPENYPAKTDVLAFLQSAKSKLNNMKVRMQPFSIAEARINELLRDIDKEIDQIQRLEMKDYAKIESESIEYCGNTGREGWEGFLRGFAGDSDAEICNEEGYNVNYTIGLYETWSVLQDKYTNNSSQTDLYDLIEPIGDDYETNLKEIFIKLHALVNNYMNIQAVRDGRAGIAYGRLQGEDAFGYAVSQSNPNDITGRSNGLLPAVTNWQLDSSVAETGQNLLAGLEQMAIIYEELKNLKFVQARLTADVVEGSAPLPVIFDILGTVDPAGGSVKGSNIAWDLGGVKTTSEIIEAAVPQMILPVDESVNCTFNPTSGTEEDIIGDTSKRCVYNKPGTYRASVKINSNDPTKYAPGVSTLTIKVNPPTTKIELKVEAGGKEHVVMDYLDEVLVTDRKEVTVTANDAKAGITFDASGTNAAQYKWSFGDGEVLEFPASSVEEHEYKEPGKYEVMLEVLNELGIIDKKIFILKISSIAARMEVRPQNGSFINTQVVFDASDSKSDLGEIVNYEWTIIPTPGQPELATLPEPINPVTESGRSLKVFTNEFKYPINYDISVTVTDDASNKDIYELKGYRIESQPPIALFSHSIPDATQPGTVNFDANDSYDPDGTENFLYEWTIEPETGWTLVNSEKNGLDSKKPIVKFTEKGDYDVTLKITDEIARDEYNEITETITIEKILDIAWAPDQEVTYILDDEGSVEAEFGLESDTAIAYEIDFGDGETQNGQFGDEITHLYTEGGEYSIIAKVFDQEDNDNSIQKRIFISGGDDPIAKISLSINGVEIQDLSQPVKVSKTDALTVDASKSKNLDGTGRNLKYSWTFGDGRNNSDKIVTHTYKELSPQDPGYFAIKLRVSDDDDPSLYDDDEIYISVINLAPRFSAVQGIVQSSSSDLVTPVMLTMKVYDARDPDGEITNYKWWYFDVNEPYEQLGTTVTQSDTTQLMIGTRGKEGEEMTYGFGLEVVDSDGMKYSNQEEILSGQYSTVTVKNGPNELPTASFNVNTTYVYAGDTITFTSSSTDPDGNLVKYIWDVNGDGFFNDNPTGESSLQHIYTSKNQEGYDVKLKVIDDKGGEAISQPVKVYVDSLAEPPVAAFKFEVVDGSNGMKIRFINNSEADENAGAKIINNKWDFDTDSILNTADSNGDGIKDNDTDSQAENPSRLYMTRGIYKVKLTTTDDHGNSDEVINQISVPLANAPIAAFTYEIVDGQVVFRNNSAVDTAGGAFIEETLWDFDTTSTLITADSNGDGLKDNDLDSALAAPVHQYSESGVYKVKLVVVDNFGMTAEVVNDVNFVTAGTANGLGETPAELKAVLVTDPVPGSDGNVHLGGNSGSVRFDFSNSVGPIAYYSIDKNIYFGTNDDDDFKTSLPGAWTTNFDKAWGRIVVKLTVTDIYGNENSTNIEIIF